MGAGFRKPRIFHRPVYISSQVYCGSWMRHKRSKHLQVTPIEGSEVGVEVYRASEARTRERVTGQKAPIRSNKQVQS